MMWNNLFPKVHMHPILLLFLIISFFTGTFVQLIILLFIVFFHELGHYTMALKFKWRIKRIMLWVFGGVMDTEEHGTRPVKEEVLVICAGPFQHIVLYGAMLIVADTGLLSPSIIDTFMYYNTAIFLFNLLPILPLDGGKLLQLILSTKWPYKLAYYRTIYFSLITCVLLLFAQLIIIPFTLSTFVLFLFLLFENKNEWQKRYYAFMRFLLQRYEKRNKPNKRRSSITVKSETALLDVFSRFYQGRDHDIHILYPNHTVKIIDESVCLHCYFNEKQYKATIGGVGNR
ncbi:MULTISPECIES: M50 family metallopeptidase [Clostridia]|uniref:M50 family metallopeptidase n=1 Tax=Clostridia TaxID=186801 RepID=UPI000EA22ECD|nr:MULTISPECIES: M50 family metallopeptidase [Clostridia]NBJ68658.1 stage IV sporulation protein FB [Roseburia sp. 1XD42-34]RKI80664.1 stage IV sporulation protein FB [Clostridium sp. 1xD42-85]